MKLGIMEKITIAITLILVLWAGFNIYNTFDRAYNSEKYINYIFDAEEKPLPKDIQKLSQKYKVYEELFNSEEPIFTYGYFKYTLKKQQSEKFHKKLEKRLKKENLNYKFLVYKNWDEYENKIEEENAAVYDGDDEKCLMENPSVQELDSVRNTAVECLQNSCIIDLKHNKYIVISRDVDFIIEQLKKYNQK